MEKERKTTKLSASSELLNYRIKMPCSACSSLMEKIDEQNQSLAQVIADQKLLSEKISKLQVTTENQSKTIVEMLAEQKIILQIINTTRQNINALTNKFPLKTEEHLHYIEDAICEANEEKYVSAINCLIDGNVMKNFERIFSRELRIMYNANGTCGKKSLKDYTKLYRVIIAAISQYSPNADKEFRTALQVVKKRHFRIISANRKEKQHLNNI